jgi:hypothetical protein
VTVIAVSDSGKLNLRAGARKTRPGREHDTQFSHVVFRTRNILVTDTSNQNGKTFRLAHFLFLDHRQNCS